MIESATLVVYFNPLMWLSLPTFNFTEIPLDHCRFFFFNIYVCQNPKKNCLINKFNLMNWTRAVKWIVLANCSVTIKRMWAKPLWHFDELKTGAKTWAILIELGWMLTMERYIPVSNVYFILKCNSNAIRLIKFWWSQ